MLFRSIKNDYLCANASIPIFQSQIQSAETLRGAIMRGPTLGDWQEYEVSGGISKADIHTAAPSLLFIACESRVTQLSLPPSRLSLSISVPHPDTAASVCVCLCVMCYVFTVCVLYVCVCVCVCNVSERVFYVFTSLSNVTFRG